MFSIIGVNLFYPNYNTCYVNINQNTINTQSNQNSYFPVENFIQSLKTNNINKESATDVDGFVIY